MGAFSMSMQRENFCESDPFFIIREIQKSVEDLGVVGLVGWYLGRRVGIQVMGRCGSKLGNYPGK